MTPVIRCVATSISLMLLVACQPFVSPVPAASGGTPAAYDQQAVWLRGAVSTQDFGILSGPPPGLGSDQTTIVAHAAITLQDAGGTLRAAGVTDAQGVFSLYRSTEAYEPVDGAYYTLDVFKRLDVGVEKRFFTLRTVVRRVGSGWQSITGTAVVVNATTTAIAKMVSDGLTTPAEVIGTVSGPAADQITPFGTFPAPALAAQVDGVRAVLDAIGDPLASTGNVWTGDYFVITADDLANLARYSVVTGNLLFLLVSGETVALPNLTTVQGDLAFVGPGTLETIDMPNLTHAGIVGINDLTITDGLKMGRLRTVDTFGLMATTIGTLDLPNLTTVDQAFGLDGTTVTNGLQLPSLTTVGGPLTVANMPTLSDLAGFVALTAAGEVIIRDNAALTTISGFARLTTVNGDLTIENNAALTTISGFPPLGPGQLTVTGQPWVTNNHATLDVAALLARITYDP